MKKVYTVWTINVIFGQKHSRLGTLEHTAGSDTIFIQIYMDALPGVPGVSKNQNFFTNETVDCPKKTQTLKNCQN